MITLRFLFAGLFACVATACVAAVVDGPDQLAKALRDAIPGTALELAPGHYGAVGIDRVTGPVQLTAARPDDPPVLTAITITNSSDIGFEAIKIDYRARPDAPLWLPAVDIRKAQGISFRRVLFEGDLATGGRAEDVGHPTGTALTIRDSRDITIEQSEIRGYERGIVLSGTDDISIRDNHLHRLRHDGIVMAAVRRVRIDGNRIDDFDRVAASADHPDMIQMFTTGTDYPSEDVRITGNLLLSGHGLWTQSIHLRNERVDMADAGTEMFYRDIEISGNVIANAHLNGILVGETDGLKILRNTLIRNDRAAGPRFTEALATPLIRVTQASRDVVIENNVAPALLHSKASDWRVEGNVVLLPASYDEALADAREGDPLDLGSYAYRPDGPLAGRDLGAPDLEPEP